MSNLLKTAWVVGEVLLVVGFLGGYAARYVHPDYLWWLQLLAPLVPYLGVALLGGAYVVTLRRRWRRLVLYMPLSALVALRLLPNLVSAEESESATLSVMTLNAQSVGYIPWVERREEVLAFISYAGPDLVCLQETIVVMQDGLDVGGSSFIAGFLLEKGYTVAARSTPAGERYKMGRSVMGRVGMGPALEIRLDAGASLPDRSAASDSSYVTRVSFVWGEDTLTVYNVHLWSFKEKVWSRGSLLQRVRRLLEYREVYRRRAREAEALRQMLEDERQPFIVCGDLNSTPHNWVYNHIAGGLHDAFEAGGFGLGHTFPRQFPVVRIDYVFFSPDFEVKPTSVGDLRYSDHLPVIARASIR